MSKYLKTWDNLYGSGVLGIGDTIFANLWGKVHENSMSFSGAMF